MKAMIFAAGLGSRLKPITDTRPKALVTVGGKTMLEHIILKLKAAGFDEIVINVHHFSNQILAFLEANQNFGVNIQISDETDCLLDTGGGLEKAYHLLYHPENMFTQKGETPYELIFEKGGALMKHSLTALLLTLALFCCLLTGCGPTPDVPGGSEGSNGSSSGSTNSGTAPDDANGTNSARLQPSVSMTSVVQPWYV